MANNHAVAETYFINKKIYIKPTYLPIYIYILI